MGAVGGFLLGIFAALHQWLDSPTSAQSAFLGLILGDLVWFLDILWRILGGLRAILDVLKQGLDGRRVAVLFISNEG